jgi:polysaccharide biosynthesis transport protein
LRSYQPQLAPIPALSGTEVALPQEAPPEHQLPSGLSLLQIYSIARHYWREIAIIAAGVTLLMAVVIKLMPKAYTATATLIVNSERENPLPNQQLVNDDLGSYVATQMDLLTSPVVLAPVVDRLSLTHDPEFGAGCSGTPSAQRQCTAQHLAAAIAVTQGRGLQLLYVSATARDPAKAALLANAVADVYLQLDRQRANDPVEAQAQRSSQELSELRAKVTEAQDKVTEFRQRYGLTDVSESANDTEMAALTALQERLLDAQHQRRALEARRQGEAQSGDEALASTHITTLRTNLASMRDQLAQMRSTLGPRHPAVVALEAQISAAQRSLNSAVGMLSSNVQTQLDRERELETQLTQAVANQRAKVLHLRQIQDEGQKLLLELQSAQSVYKQALDGYDQVKFETVRNFANVSLVSHATPPLTYSKPKKYQMFFISILAALGVGLGATFFYEIWIDRRLRCRDDLERGFGIRVLAQFEPVSLSSRSA